MKRRSKRFLHRDFCPLNFHELLSHLCVSPKFCSSCVIAQGCFGHVSQMCDRCCGLIPASANKVRAAFTEPQEMPVTLVQLLSCSRNNCWSSVSSRAHIAHPQFQSKLLFIKHPTKLTYWKSRGDSTFSHLVGHCARPGWISAVYLQNFAKLLLTVQSKGFP